ncbi:hypothetical protein [Streptomyces iconiensis]|uniref:BZIP domain-containing protein n=1 Tax=Streptomyces iconiensis TaxID=1384038 RepID=A0ABT6ZWA9_9ACTN|nr:hypothetical protein [Streptomyces iconiensis]MDJ1133369.1 hypothetical protein [Streptomyces iconiensis]
MAQAEDGAADAGSMRLNGDGTTPVFGQQGGTFAPPRYGPLAPASPGGQQSDLAHSEAMKRKAAGYIERTLGPDTHKASVIADEDSEAITGSKDVPSSVRPGGGGTLKGWRVRAALQTRASRFGRRAKNLENRLKAERETLLDVNKLFGHNETLTSNGFNKLRPSSGAGFDAPPGLSAPKSKLDDL